MKGSDKKDNKNTCKGKCKNKCDVCSKKTDSNKNVLDPPKPNDLRLNTGQQKSAEKGNLKCGGLGKGAKVDFSVYGKTGDCGTNESKNVDVKNAKNDRCGKCSTEKVPSKTETAEKNNGNRVKSNRCMKSVPKKQTGCKGKLCGECQPKNNVFCVCDKNDDKFKHNGLISKNDGQNHANSSKETLRKQNITKKISEIIGSNSDGHNKKNSEKNQKITYVPIPPQHNKNISINDDIDYKVNLIQEKKINNVSKNRRISSIPKKKNTFKTGNANVKGDKIIEFGHEINQDHSVKIVRNRNDELNKLEVINFVDDEINTGIGNSGYLELKSKKRVHANSLLVENSFSYIENLKNDPFSLIKGNSISEENNSEIEKEFADYQKLILSEEAKEIANKNNLSAKISKIDNENSVKCGSKTKVSNNDSFSNSLLKESNERTEYNETNKLDLIEIKDLKVIEFVEDTEINNQNEVEKGFLVEGENVLVDDSSFVTGSLIEESVLDNKLNEKEPICNDFIVVETYKGLGIPLTHEMVNNIALINQQTGEIEEESSTDQSFHQHPVTIEIKSPCRSIIMEETNTNEENKSDIEKNDNSSSSMAEGSKTNAEMPIKKGKVSNLVRFFENKKDS